MTTVDYDLMERNLRFDRNGSFLPLSLIAGASVLNIFLLTAQAPFHVPFGLSLTEYILILGYYDPVFGGVSPYLNLLLIGAFFLGAYLIKQWGWGWLLFVFMLFLAFDTLVAVQLRLFGTAIVHLLLIGWLFFSARAQVLLWRLYLTNRTTKGMPQA